MNWVFVKLYGNPPPDMHVYAVVAHKQKYASECFSVETLIAEISSNHKNKWVAVNPGMASGNSILCLDNINTEVICWQPVPNLPFEVLLRLQVGFMP